MSFVVDGPFVSCFTLSCFTLSRFVARRRAGSWDTCAPEALLRTAGGDITDLFGERLVYLAEPPPPATHLNACGVIASAAGYEGTHRAVCAAMRRSVHALGRVEPWGLDRAAVQRPDDGQADIVGVLRERRERLAAALSGDTRPS
eukprot:670731-Prymnesium_polylepis.2